MNITVQSILDFWFADAAENSQTATQRMAFWFGGDEQAAERDAQIKERFGGAVDSALLGSLDDWAREPRGRLALILLLDQFTRNIYRGTPRAFEGDARAIALTLEGLDAGADRTLYPIERVFFLMPLQHAEDLPTQERSLVEFSRLCADAPETQREFYDGVMRYARIHHELIERFGRFPHRNTALKRANSAEEEEYFAGEVERFGQ